MNDASMSYRTRLHSLIVIPAGAEMFSEGVTTIGVDDDGGGVYFTLTQGEHKVRIDAAEWPHIAAAVERMMEEWRDE